MAIRKVRPVRPLPMINNITRVPGGVLVQLGTPFYTPGFQSAIRHGQGPVPPYGGDPDEQDREGGDKGYEIPRQAQPV